MERRSSQKRVFDDREIREALSLLDNEDDGKSCEGSSDEDTRDFDDDPLDCIDLEDDRDPDFNPTNLSSSESDLNSDGFDTELEEDAISIAICNTEKPNNEIASSSSKVLAGDSKQTKKTSTRKIQAKKKKKSGGTNESENPKRMPPNKKKKSEKMDILRDEDILVKFDSREVTGKTRKDGTVFVWQSEPISSTDNTKVPKRNLVHMQPGPVGAARDALEPINCFQLFFNSFMLEVIKKNTNQEINQIKKDSSEQKEIYDMDELKALIGLLIYGGAKQDNHLPTSLLFNVSQCGYWYRTAMSKKRFEFLIRALRYDDKTCRPNEKFAPISELWGLFIENCKKWYKPGSYVTIDEQLVGFRGNCPFRMYLPNKPSKYGLKIIAMVDSSTKYLLNAIPYTGKGSTPADQPAAAYFVKKLVEPIENSNRNITIDNWFTSIKLISDLLDKGLTVVGTIRKDKIELPPSFIDVKFKQRKVGSSLFLHHSEMTAVSYKSKMNKLVTLVSSMHDKPEIHPFSKKPYIIHSYNATKGGVDTLDQLCAHSSCNRKTKRWPVCFFYNMLNIACVNSYVIYQHNYTRIHHKDNDAAKPLTRLQFMIKLHEQLTFDWKQKRLESITRINLNLKENITQSLMESMPPTLPVNEEVIPINSNGLEPTNEMEVDEPSAADFLAVPSCSTGDEQTSLAGTSVLNEEQGEKSKKKYYKLGNCSVCPSRLRKKAISLCSQCKKRLCGGHIKKKENFCQDCSSE